MNKTGRVADYLGHILQAMARIERHTAGVDAVGFAEDSSKGLLRGHAAGYGAFEPEAFVQ